jgi:hypothetical protein
MKQYDAIVKALQRSMLDEGDFMGCGAMTESPKGAITSGAHSRRKLGIGQAFTKANAKAVVDAAVESVLHKGVKAIQGRSSSLFEDGAAFMEAK